MLGFVVLMYGVISVRIPVLRVSLSRLWQHGHSFF